MDMKSFADYWRLREQIEEALETFNIEAASLIIDDIEKNGKCLIARVMWRSPLVKIGQKKDTDAVHLTLMDAAGMEITGSALGQVAIVFDEKLEKDRIYKFANVFKRRKANGTFHSRLVAQEFELRFAASSGGSKSEPANAVVPPERITQDPYPKLDHSAFRTDYERIASDDIVAILGVYLGEPIPNQDVHRVMITNGPGQYAAVQLSNEKYDEFKMHERIRFRTIVAFHGVKKTGNKLGFNMVCDEFVAFDDTVIIRTPDCKAATALRSWCGQVVTDQVETLSS